MNGPSALRGIHESFRQGPTGREVWFGLVCASLLLVLLLIHVLVLHLRRRRRAIRDWIEFREKIGEWKLNRVEAELLTDMARRTSLLHPTEVALKTASFEKAVDRTLRPLCAANRDPEQAREVGEVIHSIRRKLGFGARRGGVYLSTRQIPSGQSLHLKCPAAHGQADVWGKVDRPREDFLSVADLQPVDVVKAGMELRVILFEDSRSHSFSTRVAAADSSKASCLLVHSLAIGSAGTREYHRVQLDSPVTFRAIWEEDSVAREGTLLNLSAGGLALVAPCYYEADEHVYVSINPGSIARGKAGGLREREIAGLVVAANRLDDGHCRYHVDFRDIAAPDREYLMRLVHLLEIQEKGNEVRE